MLQLISGILGGAVSGALLTWILNYKENKRKVHFEAITNKRIEWAEQLKKDIPDFIAGIQNYFIVNRVERLILRKKLVSLMEQISIKLNPVNDDFDDEFINTMRRVFENTIKFVVDNEEINRFRILSQSMVKIEWEGIKLEAKYGNLSKEEKLKLRRKWLV